MASKFKNQIRISEKNRGGKEMKAVKAILLAMHWMHWIFQQRTNKLHEYK